MLNATAPNSTVRIDPEFAAAIPPVRPEEREALATSIRKEGCRDSLVVWSSGSLLLDGHNRLAICQSEGVPFRVVNIDLPNRAAALAWIVRNQLARRNLTPDQASYLRGLEYDLTKQVPHRPKKGGQNVHLNTADALAKRHGVDAKTIRRDATFARAVDALEAGPAPGIKMRVLSGDGPPKAVVVEAAKVARKEPKRAATMLSAPKPHVANNSGDNEWYTPEAYIKAACDVMGRIDVDPASTLEANGVVKASTFFTAEQDGLAQEWWGNIWLNPPYASGLVERFAEKLISSERVTQAVVLVNNATETRWFQLLLSKAAALCLPAGRIKFWHPRKVAAPLQGQAILYFGPKEDAFFTYFQQFGAVCHLVRNDWF